MNNQISIVFLSVKSIIMKIKEWYHVYLTPNISAKTWSNWTSRGGFEIVRWRWSMVIGYYSSFTLYHSKLLYFKSIMVKLNVIFFSMKMLLRRTVNSTDRTQSSRDGKQSYRYRQGQTTPLHIWVHTHEQSEYCHCHSGCWHAGPSVCLTSLASRKPQSQADCIGLWLWSSGPAWHGQYYCHWRLPLALVWPRSQRRPGPWFGPS